MKTIHFSEVGVRSFEELEQIIMMYEILGIEFAFDFKHDVEKAHKSGIQNRFIQTSTSCVSVNTEDVEISFINYPVKYVIDSINFAVAYQLLKTNQEGELLAHLNKYCKEYSNA